MVEPSMKLLVERYFVKLPDEVNKYKCKICLKEKSKTVYVTQLISHGYRGFHSHAEASKFIYVILIRDIYVIYHIESFYI